MSLLLLACGGGADGALFDQVTASGSAGGDASVGTSEAPGAAGVATAGTGQVSEAGSSAAPAGGSGGQAATAGNASNQAGSASTAGSGGAHSSTGGTGSAGMAGAPVTAGSAGSGGSGGTQQTDPLDPQPVADCPGYVSVTVPHATCVWFSGEFTLQDPTCGTVNPPSKKCATASAPGEPVTVIASVSAKIQRFDFGATGCPKVCQ